MNAYGIEYETKIVTIQPKAEIIIVDIQRLIFIKHRKQYLKMVFLQY